MCDKLRLIPELAGVPVIAYDEFFPDRNDVAMAIWKMQVPSLLVIWRGSLPSSNGTFEIWKHMYGIAIRSDDQAGSQYSYFALWSAIANGHVSGDGESFRLCPVHESVYAMDTPSISRQTLFITESSRLDYHEVAIALPEKGDWKTNGLNARFAHRNRV